MMSNQNRSSIKLIPGELVTVNDQSYRIKEVIDFNIILGTNLETGRHETLAVKELKPLEETTSSHIDIDELTDKEWKTANARYAAIQPLLMQHYGRRDVEARAKEINVAFTTLYRWLKLYNDAGSLDGLIPDKPGRKKGNYRISYHAEEIIKQVIETVYLTKQRPTIEKVVLEVKRRCSEAKLPDIPHANTIRSRVNQVSDFDRIRKRRGRDKANKLYKPTPGKLEASYPLDMVQIDHTEVDIILVDDTYRKPIGRPWITVAIDVYSRMIVGYYLSFDAPSATSIAMCVSHSILPKEEWMTLHNVNSTWPVWGVMDRLHVDNGSDFRSEAFRKACMMHCISLEYRPVKQPQFGGHIERLLGTFMNEVHDLPGTTFSSTKHKDTYDSEKESAMTISEFEAWLVTFICKIYHKRLHTGIGLTPEKKWEIGIFGNNEVNGCGARPIPKNRLHTLLDFLPMFPRTIQRYGISLDNINYYSDVLRHWVNARDPEDRSKKRQFIIRRDPRDISQIWFYDPELKEYLSIPYADQSQPSMSIWELRKATQKAREAGSQSVNELQIFSALTELRSIVQESAEKTKKARRSNQNRKRHAKKINPVAPLKSKIAIQEKPSNLSSDILDDDIDLNGFGDIA